MNSIKKLFQSPIEKMFGKDITLEHTIFTCVAIAGIFMAAIGIVSNYSLGLPKIIILIPFVNIVLDVFCIVYSVLKKRWQGTAIVVVFYAIFVLFPFAWFTGGGASGATMPFIVLSGFVIVIIFQGKFRLVIVCVTLLLYVSFIFLEMKYPNIYVPYASREAWDIDLAIGLILSYSAIVALSFTVLSRYKKAKLEAEDLVKQLKALALTDPLTGIFNRRYLMSCIDEEMRTSYDDGRPLTICIMDIDFFKKINDTYGHICGDEVLIKISKIISECLSEREVFGRYGGEEFLVIFRNCDLEPSLKIIDKIYVKLRATEWEHGSSVTISSGVSAYTNSISYSKFIESADINLYKAKENGRDQVIW